MSAVTTADIRPRLLDVLSSKGGTQINPNVVLDAATYLELAGETIRARICTFTDADGVEQCLRPDMTIPLARMVADGEIEPSRYYFSGRVFRLPEAGTNDPLEFSHTGFEDFGAESSPRADASGIAVALEALEAAGVKQRNLQLGDSSLFHSFVSAFDLPTPWPTRLAAAFTRQGGPEALIANSTSAADESSPLARVLSTLPEGDAERAVEEMLSLSGISVIGGRTAGDIAERLIKKAEQSIVGPLPDAAGKAILSFMQVEGEARTCVDEISRLADKVGVDVSSALERFSARLDILDKLALAKGLNTSFSSGFGRRFDYYDGLIFEIQAEIGGRALVSGGRYDGLIAKLSSGKRKASAFGVAMRPDRIADAANTEAKS